jgi:hypothetical protein
MAFMTDPLSSKPFMLVTSAAATSPRAISSSKRVSQAVCVVPSSRRAGS